MRRQLHSNNNVFSSLFGKCTVLEEVTDKQNEKAPQNFGKKRKRKMQTEVRKISRA